MTHDPMVLPADLPVPDDDGAADHLRGAFPVPAVALPATTGDLIDLQTASADRRLVVFCYPRTGRPGEDPLVPDWDAIPGARGCTPEVCSFRDLYAEIRATGADVVGVSTQSPADQQEAVERLHLPYPLLSDEELGLAGEMSLPTLEVGGRELLRRLTMLVNGGVVEHVWYPVFPPHTHAADVLAYLSTTER